MASRARPARLKVGVEVARARVETARETVPVVDIAYVAAASDRQLGGNLLACAVAYRLFLWLLPLALLVAGLLGLLGSLDDDAPGTLADDLGLGAYVTSTVSDAATQAGRSWWALLALAVFGLYMASSAAARTMRVVAAMAWNELPPPPKRRWAPPLAFAGFAFAISLLVLGMNWVDGTSDRVGLVVRLLAIAAFAAIGLGIAIALPHRDVSWVHLVPGALTIAIGAQAIHLVSVLYLARRLDSSSELYGGLGAAATVLLWLYLIGRLLVAASVLNASLWHRRRGRAPDEVAA